MYSTLSVFHLCPAWDGKTTQKTTKQLEGSRSESKAMTLGWDVITVLKQPQPNGEILSQRSAASEISHVTDRQNPSKAKNQSSSFSSFNHDGQLQRRAVDEISPTQTTKPSLQRIASSRSFYCHSVSLSVSFLSVFFSVSPSFYSPLQSPSRAEWCMLVFSLHPTKEILARKACVIPPKQIRIRSAVESLRGLGRKSVVWCVDTTLI